MTNHTGIAFAFAFAIGLGVSMIGPSNAISKEASVVVEAPKPIAPVYVPPAAQPEPIAAKPSKPAIDEECVKNIKTTIVLACFRDCSRGEAAGFDTSAAGIKACRQVCLAGGAALADRECRG